MPTKVEKDSVTGVETTGHEWDGIRELNNPLPKWWLYTFYACIIFSVIWWVLYPSWPGRNGYLPGLLGSNQRVELDQRMAAAQQAQAVWRDRIAAADVPAILADPDLLQFANAGGQAAFNTNCAPCHGLGGAGQGFFPTLADDDWIWGGKPDQIEFTIRHGIRNAEDPDARINEMPKFGADGILTREQIDDVVAYLLSLGGQSVDQAKATAGQTVYAENCAACHGDDAKGLPDLGAPNLTDSIWLYGGTAEQIAAQIWSPRQGVMPPWQGRLDDATIKMLTAYVHSLGGGQ
ncbi:MAG: cytochrome-c oxidase, cbb3-type subunit III [Geminicoccaceae bacterium]